MVRFNSSRKSEHPNISLQQEAQTCRSTQTKTNILRLLPPPQLSLTYTHTHTHKGARAHIHTESSAANIHHPFTLIFKSECCCVCITIWRVSRHFFNNRSSPKNTIFTTIVAHRKSGIKIAQKLTQSPVYKGSTCIQLKVMQLSNIYCSLHQHMYICPA